MLQYFKKSPKKHPAEQAHSSDEHQQGGGKVSEEDRERPSVEANAQSKQSDASNKSPPESEDLSTSNDSSPVLTEEDENFLLRIATEGEDAPPLPPRPISRAEANEKHERLTSEAPGEERPKSSSRSHDAKAWAEKWLDWSMQPIRPTSDYAVKKYQELSQGRQATILELQKASSRRQAADSLQHAAGAVRAEQTKPQTPTAQEVEDETKQETKEMGSILAKLDLSSINNRAVGISKDTQKLLESFNQVLKDIVNGVPTAYQDLEKLLTERQGQLEKLYGGLPPFIQSLVKTIPVKVYALLAPQLAAAMSNEKAAESKNSGADGAAGSSKEKKHQKRKYVLPTLKSLVGQKGAVAAMLRSIIGFLELRFPALLAGTNVIVSLAVFILLFVFWYCHKRGRETRLAKMAAADESSDDDSESAEDDDGEILSELEKGSSVDARRLAAADGGNDVEKNPPRASAAKGNADAEIEGKVDVLMKQLGEPTPEKKPVR